MVHPVFAVVHPAANGQPAQASAKAVGRWRDLPMGRGEDVDRRVTDRGGKLYAAQQQDPHPVAARGIKPLSFADRDRLLSQVGDPVLDGEDCGEGGEGDATGDAGDESDASKVVYGDA